MPGALCRILGLHHTAQSKPANDCFFTAALNLGQKLLNFFWMNIILLRFQMIPEIPDKGCQIADSVRIRLLMCAIYKRKFQPEKMLCNRFICNQHKIFDQIGRGIALIWLYLDWISVFVQKYFGFRKIKIN